MTIESTVSDLTVSTTALLTAVGAQQTSIANAVSTFSATTARVATGLNNVDNTHDVDKPISTATATALSLKQSNLVSGINISTVNGISLLGGGPLVIARSATSINRVTYDNRNSLRSSVAQVDDSTMVESLGLFMWVNTQDEPDDDETCFTTTSGQWLLQAPAWDLLDAWGLIEKSILDDWMEDEPTRYSSYKLKG